MRFISALSLVFAVSLHAAPKKTVRVAHVGSAFSYDIAKALKIPAGVPAVFSKTSGPVWLSVSPAGLCTGTPAAADKGKNVFKILGQVATKPAEEGQLIVHVRKARTDHPLVCENGEEAEYIGKSDNGDADLFACPL